MLFRRFVAAAIAAFSLAGAVVAQSGATVTRTFLVGLGTPETAEILVVNLANSSSSGPAASCIGSIAFFNAAGTAIGTRSEEHTSELQSLRHLVCRLLLEKKKLCPQRNTIVTFYDVTIRSCTSINEI